MRPNLSILSFSLLCFSSALSAQVDITKPVESPLFAVSAYVLEGNILLSDDQLSTHIAPFIGQNKQFSDVQQVLKAVEDAYRAQGYSGIRVIVPEQSLENGQVRLKVIEGRVGTVTIAGNKNHDEDNIRASLPSLKEGQPPRVKDLAESIQLSNENASKYIDVLLNTGADEGKIDAEMRVNDARAYGASVTLDNTGTPETGRYRVNASQQHNNLWNKDHSLALSYIASPQKIEGVRIGVFSLAYRIPFYNLSSSVDFLYAHSSANIATQSLAGGLGIVGSGDIYSARWNYLLERQGEYTSRISVSQDLRDMKSSCEFGNEKLTGVAGCEDYRLMPFALTYVGQLTQLSGSFGGSLSVATNLGGSDQASYKLAAGDRQTNTKAPIWRVSTAISQNLPADFIWRANAQAQYASSNLVLSEQLGLAGSSAVRGFAERAFASDRGFVVQNELHTPDLAALTKLPGNLRALAFADYGNGTSREILGFKNVVIASAGVGLRYNYKRDFSWRFDLAKVLNSHPEAPGQAELDKRWRVHFSLNGNF